MIAVIFSLTVGLLDLGRGLWMRSPELSSVSFLLQSFAAAVIALFFLYWVCLFPARLILGRILKTSSGFIAWTLSFCLGSTLLFAVWNDLLHFPLRIEGFVSIFVLGSAVLAMTVLFYHARNGDRDWLRHKEWIENFLCALPLLLAEAVLALWFFSRPGAFGPAILVALLLPLLGVTIFIFFKSGGGLAKRGKWPVVLFVLVVLSALSISFLPRPQVIQGPSSPASHKIRHVILLTVDTLRPDALSSFSDKGTQTPQMDRLAEEGYSFTQALSAAPWTWPGVASMMTGLSPTVLKLGYHVGRQGKLSDQATTLAESMQAAGYRTAAIGRNAFLLPHSNISQGFQEYDFYPKFRGSGLGSKILKRLWPAQFRSDATTTDLTELAIRWLRANHGTDFFLWLHYFDPHDPYAPPERFLPKKEPVASIGKSFDEFSEVRGGYLVLNQEEKEWIRELYLGEVRYVDHAIGRVVAELKRLGIYDETLIVLSSDHGEEMWEHGLIGHGHSIYREMLQVPLIVKPPVSLGKPSQRIAVPVSTSQIFPTLLDLAGVNYDAERLSGPSLVPYWEKGSEASSGGPVVSTGLRYYEDRVSLIAENFQYIRFLETGKEELYDLEKDPLAQVSLAASATERMVWARQMLADHEKGSDSLRAYHQLTRGEDVELDKETLENLRSLGYVN